MQEDISKDKKKLILSASYNRDVQKGLDNDTLSFWNGRTVDSPENSDPQTIKRQKKYNRVKMVAAGTRKGFKFVAASKPVVTEKISFEDVEKESTTTPGASRKRAATKAAAEVKALKSRKTVIASSTAKTSRSGENKSSKNISPMHQAADAADAGAPTSGSRSKAHYPIIDMPMHKIINLIKEKGNTKSHAELLDRIVIEVCQAEQAGLAAFFQINTGKGRDAIHEVLTTILDDIPTAVTSNCPEDVEFQPEFAAGEKAESSTLNSALEELREHTAKLAAYEKDLSKLAKDCDIWIEGPSEDAFARHTSAGNDGDSGNSLGIDSAAASYQDLLHGVAQSCTSILARTAEATATENQAAGVQERLYMNYNRVRLGAGPAGVSLPAGSAKDILKNLAKKSV